MAVVGPLGPVLRVPPVRAEQSCTSSPLSCSPPCSTALTTTHSAFLLLNMTQGCASCICASQDFRRLWNRWHATHTFNVTGSSQAWSHFPQIKIYVSQPKNNPDSGQTHSRICAVAEELYPQSTKLPQCCPFEVEPEGLSPRGHSLQQNPLAANVMNSVETGSVFLVCTFCYS